MSQCTLIGKNTKYKTLVDKRRFWSGEEQAYNLIVHL